MAQNYKLTYLNIRGLGEFIRYLFTYGNVEFEDKRVDYQLDWPKLKEQTPFGQLPVLEQNGKLIHQSVAIGRYVAKLVKKNLSGQNDWEDLEIDSIVETHADLINSSCCTLDEVKKKILKETFSSETILVAAGGEMSDVLGKYPTLLSFKTKVESLPAIKKWIETRPKSPL